MIRYMLNMKVLRWISDNILFLIVLFLLAFLPLFPKKPLMDITNTWVYIRTEDFVVLAVLIIWAILLFRKKITLKTPLTIPILLFWIVGALSTIHGVLLIFPETANTFSNVALLSMLRRIEYISLFFVGFAAIKDKRSLTYIVALLAGTLFCVFLYGLGQKYLGFPAYLTMNEEFAKGIPIQLSALSRVPSTFAGHYDLAAYLVLVIPILTSMIFGFRNWLVKILLSIAVLSGIILLFMTVSRVSFFVLFIALSVLFFFYKKRWVFYSLPIVAVIFSILFISFAPSLMDRFGNTVKEVDVLVNAQTGEVIGNIKRVSVEDFANKPVKQWPYQASAGVTTQALTIQKLEQASPSAAVPFELIPIKGVLYVPPNASTGESLPQGTGYINLPLSPVQEQLNEFFYEPTNDNVATNSSEILMFSGNFLIKRAAAYDLSFTIRYQGEWPHAIEAFKRNIFLGSGYSSISLSIDNSYLRMLGEVGFLGIASFLVIFIAAGVFIKKALQHVDSPSTRSFVIGFVAGVIGLALNALLIDVFEASKVAFYLWLLMGVTLGILSLYYKEHVSLYSYLRKVGTSSYAIILYLGILTLFMFSPMISSYFVGDDFKWLRWAAECASNGQCPTYFDRIFQYFTQADGFFYRPGTKVYFLLMYSSFWLNPVAYHIVSLLLHFIVVVLVFLLAQKVLRNFKLTVFATFIFAVLSGYSEAIFWIASVGVLFSVMFVLLSVLLFIKWHEQKHILYYIFSILSMLLGLFFHELAIITPLLLLVYQFTQGSSFQTNTISKRMYYGILLLVVGFYLVMRFVANARWYGGDFGYSILLIPFNAIGYFFLTMFGPIALPVYEGLITLSKVHVVVPILVFLLVIVCIPLVIRLLKKLHRDDKRVILFGCGFMIVTSLPFLGLDQLNPQYVYLMSFGFVIVLVQVIRNLYKYLVSSGQDIAIASITLLTSIFLLLHIIQVQKIQDDWFEAGLKVNRFLVSIEGYYEDHWSTTPLKLHFVNIPIRSGDAWVFPEGIDDALWFSFKNSQMTFYQWPSEEKALSVAKDPITEKVFIFDEHGVVTARKIPLPGIQ